MSVSLLAKIVLRLPFVAYVARLASARDYLELLLLTVNLVLGVTLLAVWSGALGVVATVVINLALVSAWLLFTALV